jgi:hypothetical protein
MTRAGIGIAYHGYGMENLSLKNIAWFLFLVAFIGLTGCAQVTESVNGAGRSIEGFFSPNK